MPLLIRTNQFSVRGNDGTYSSFDAVSDRTTEERVQEINNAKEDAIEEIDEALSQIPTKYSDMSTAVSTLQGKVTDLETNVTAISLDVIEALANS